MKRRQFIKSTVGGALISSVAFKPLNSTKSHIVSFSFDDGFKKSFIKLAEIHEEYGLKACLNVIASGHMKNFQAVDAWILPELMGDFDTWNNLVSRGHEIMPHSWKHLNLARQEPDEAKELITKCIDYFTENLDGFSASKAVFNFPFNSSNDELDRHALTLVRAVRTRGNAINPIPSSKNRKILGCTTNGPNNNDDWVEDKVNSFLATEGGWLIFNLHGLDNEGWGPISTNYFDGLLKRLVEIENLDIIPVGMALEKYSSD